MHGEGKRKRKKAGKVTLKRLSKYVAKKTTKRGKSRTTVSQVVTVNIGKNGRRKGVSAKKVAPKTASTIIERFIHHPPTAAAAPQVIVVKAHPGRELEKKDVRRLKRGEAPPPDAQLVAIAKNEKGDYERVDVTDAYNRAFEAMTRKAKEDKEQTHKEREEKHRAVEQAHKEREEKHRAKEETAMEKVGRINAEIAARRATLKKSLKFAQEEAKKLKITRSVKKISKSHDELIAQILEKEFGVPAARATAPKKPSEKEKEEKEKKPIFLDLGEMDSKEPQGGHGRERLKRPTSSDEIDKAMSKVPGFQGAVPSDADFSVKGEPPSKGVSWVMNLDPSSQPGSHWVAVLITPHSVEYSDSFGDDPTPSVQERLVAAGKRLWPENRKTLKVNRVKRQDERTVDCGFHAMKFIHDRLSGKTFPQATGYDAEGGQVRKSEEEVKAFEKRYPKFVQVGNGILDHPGDNMPHAVKSMLEKHGQEPISSLQVVRTPVNSLITKILNVGTFGAFKEALKRYNYDQLFHLALNVNGRYKLEKNATVHFSAGTVSSGEKRPVSVPRGLKIADLFKRGGSAGFWLYDPRNNNCQDFMVTVLSGIGALTPDLRSFIKQDVEGVFKQTPSYASKVAKFVTNLGARFDGAKDKIRKFFGRGQKGGFVTLPPGVDKNDPAAVRRAMAEIERNLDKPSHTMTYNDHPRTAGPRAANYGEKPTYGDWNVWGKLKNWLKKLTGGKRRQKGGLANYRKPMPDITKAGPKTYGATVDLGPRFRTQPRVGPPVTVI